MMLDLKFEITFLVCNADALFTNFSNVHRNIQTTIYADVL